MNTTTNATAHQPTEPPPSPPPPKGAPIWVVLIVLALLALSFVAGAAVWPRLQGKGSPGGANVTSAAHDHTGGAMTEPEPDAAHYTCAMHPWVLLPEPGICPICHMQLTPVDSGAFTGEVVISPVVVQNIGVRARPVISGPIEKTIRTIGTIEYDETALRDVNIKVEGWIEKLHVDFVGADVRAGEPLFELYSPRLYAAQEEYLSARRLADDGAAGGLHPERLLTDARTQLEFLDMTDAQIRDLEARGEAMRRTPILSPHTGVVIDKHANEGMRIEPGMRLFRIADLSTVWVIASVYEHQLPFIDVGQPAIMSLSYIPGQAFEGQVLYVYPYLDPKSRQAAVRLAFENPHGLLKPGMFANVELRKTLARERTLAPRSAIIDTGERQVAFVSLGAGRFEPRDVRTGLTTDGDLVEILDGLKPGEMVVTSAQFLLDSESNLREALAKMMSDDLVADDASTAPSAPPRGITSLPEPVETALVAMLTDYLAIGEQLAGDTLERIDTRAARIVQNAQSIVENEIPSDPHFWHTHDQPARIGAAARALAGATDIATARRHYADLSLALSSLLRDTGVPPSFEQEVQELRCPMYHEDQGGGYWLQPAGDVRNPFFGSMMLRCFDQRITLPVTGRQHDAGPSAGDAP